MKTNSTTEPVLWDESRMASPHHQADKSHRVQRMFDAIAPTYELINRLATGGRDAAWRREMVRLAEVKPGDVLLDVACGTGDVARAFAESPVPPARTIGLDFSECMLQHAAERPVDSVSYWRGDGLRLPVSDGAVSIVTCAFGIRNFQDLHAGLREMHRVLCPGGRAILLEISVPSNGLLRGMYLAYFKTLMPIVATWISRDRTGAYRYLPHSVVSFQGRKELCQSLRRAGFADVTSHSRTFGAVHLYRAVKSDGSHSENGHRPTE